MRLKIHHITTYEFEQPVSFGLQQIRKTPKSTHNQRVLDWTTTVTGGRKELSFDDHHNNKTELIGFEREATSLEVVSEGQVDIQDTAGVVGRHLGPSPLWLYQRPTERTEARAGIKALVKKVRAETDLEAIHALSNVIRNDIAYEVGTSEPQWTAEDAIEAGRGVCQDHTHIFLACARHMGLPARYVSGYLMLDDRTAQNAMHAWAEAHVDGLGWVGCDISNGISPDTRYVRVATGLDYADAAPVSGMRTGGAGEKLTVRIDVSQQ